MKIEKPSNWPLVYVIILNWNGWGDTVECLSSLEGLEYPDYEVVVVDNGSTDGSEDKIREACPNVTVLQTGANLGFAGGNNVGIRHALEQGVDYVWLLNNDTEVDRGALTALVMEALSDTSIGMVGSKIYYYKPPDMIWFAGGTVNMRTGKTEHILSQQRDVGQWDEPRDMDYVTACSMLVSRETIESIGVLDTMFFLYFEETDWEVRAKSNGWRVRYTPKSTVWHKVSSSSKFNSPTMVFHFAKSSILFARKHISARPFLPLLVTVRHQVLPFLVRGKLTTAAAGIRGLRSGIRSGIDGA